MDRSNEEKELFKIFQEEVRENRSKFIEKVEELKEISKNRKKSSRRNQLNKIKDENTNYQTFLRLYVFYTGDNLLYFDEEDKNEKSYLKRFLNIITNEDDDLLKDNQDNSHEKKWSIWFSEWSFAIFDIYKAVRLEENELLKRGEGVYNKICGNEVKMMKNFQDDLVKSLKNIWKSTLLFYFNNSL